MKLTIRDRPKKLQKTPGKYEVTITNRQSNSVHTNEPDTVTLRSGAIIDTIGEYNN